MKSAISHNDDIPLTIKEETFDRDYDRIVQFGAAQAEGLESIKLSLSTIKELKSENDPDMLNVGDSLGEIPVTLQDTVHPNYALQNDSSVAWRVDDITTPISIKEEVIDEDYYISQYRAKQSAALQKIEVFPFNTVDIKLEDPDIVKTNILPHTLREIPVGIEEKEECKVLRKLDRNNKSAPFIKCINWKIGQYLKVKVKNIWYDAKIIKIDWSACLVKIHFINWNSRFDLFLPIESKSISYSEGINHIKNCRRDNNVINQGIKKTKFNGKQFRIKKFPNKYKCTFSGCTKWFRKENRFESHVKQHICKSKEKGHKVFKSSVTEAVKLKSRSNVSETILTKNSKTVMKNLKRDANIRKKEVEGRKVSPKVAAILRIVAKSIHLKLNSKNNSKTEILKHTKQDGSVPKSFVTDVSQKTNDSLRNPVPNNCKDLCDSSTAVDSANRSQGGDEKLPNCSSSTILMLLPANFASSEASLRPIIKEMHSPNKCENLDSKDMNEAKNRNPETVEFQDEPFAEVEDNSADRKKAVYSKVYPSILTQSFSRTLFSNKKSENRMVDRNTLSDSVVAALHKFEKDQKQMNNCLINDTNKMSNLITDAVKDDCEVSKTEMSRDNVFDQDMQPSYQDGANLEEGNECGTKNQGLPVAENTALLVSCACEIEVPAKYPKSATKIHSPKMSSIPLISKTQDKSITSSHEATAREAANTPSHTNNIQDKNLITEKEIEGNAVLYPQHKLEKLNRAKKTKHRRTRFKEDTIFMDTMSINNTSPVCQTGDGIVAQFDHCKSLKHSLHATTALEEHQVKNNDPFVSKSAEAVNNYDNKQTTHVYFLDMIVNDIFLNNFLTNEEIHTLNVLRPTAMQYLEDTKFDAPNVKCRKDMDFCLKRPVFYSRKSI